jgi:hypothetical protein
VATCCLCTPATAPDRAQYLSIAAILDTGIRSRKILCIVLGTLCVLGQDVCVWSHAPSLTAETFRATTCTTLVGVQISFCWACRVKSTCRAKAQPVSLATTSVNQRISFPSIRRDHSCRASRHGIEPQLPVKVALSGHTPHVCSAACGAQLVVRLHDVDLTHLPTAYMAPYTCSVFGIYFSLPVFAAALRCKTLAVYEHWGGVGRRGNAGQVDARTSPASPRNAQPVMLHVNQWFLGSSRLLAQTQSAQSYFNLKLKFLTAIHWVGHCGVLRITFACAMPATDYRSGHAEQQTCTHLLFHCTYGLHTGCVRLAGSVDAAGRDLHRLVRFQCCNLAFTALMDACTVFASGPVDDNPASGRDAPGFEFVSCTAHLPWPKERCFTLVG